MYFGISPFLLRFSLSLLLTFTSSSDAQLSIQAARAGTAAAAAPARSARALPGPWEGAVPTKAVQATVAATAPTSARCV